MNYTVKLLQKLCKQQLISMRIPIGKSADYNYFYQRFIQCDFRPQLVIKCPDAFCTMFSQVCVVCGNSQDLELCCVSEAQQAILQNITYETRAQVVPIGTEDPVNRIILVQRSPYVNYAEFYDQIVARVDPKLKFAHSFCSWAIELSTEMHQYLTELMPPGLGPEVYIVPHNSIFKKLFDKREKMVQLHKMVQNLGAMQPVIVDVVLSSGNFLPMIKQIVSGFTLAGKKLDIAITSRADVRLFQKEENYLHDNQDNVIVDLRLRICDSYGLRFETTPVEFIGSQEVLLGQTISIQTVNQAVSFAIEESAPTQQTPSKMSTSTPAQAIAVNTAPKTVASPPSVVPAQKQIQEKLIEKKPEPKQAPKPEPESKQPVAKAQAEPAPSKVQKETPAVPVNAIQLYAAIQHLQSVTPPGQRIAVLCKPQCKCAAVSKDVGVIFLDSDATLNPASAADIVLIK